MKETIMSKISDEEFAKIVAASTTYKEIAYKCGYSCNSGASNNIVKNRIKSLNLIFNSNRPDAIRRDDNDIFVVDSEVSQAVLRNHYLKGHYSPYKCAICGQEPIWNGKELVLTLDHINGHNKDDRLENLRWVCPNCDRQLDTFAGKNIITDTMKNYCIDCGVEIAKSSTRCPICANKEKGKIQRRVERPEREELKSLIRSMSFVEIGRQYGVTDNAIRKWCDEYSLPRTKKVISKIKDVDWQNI